MAASNAKDLQKFSGNNKGEKKDIKSEENKLIKSRIQSKDDKKFATGKDSFIDEIKRKYADFQNKKNLTTLLKSTDNLEKVKKEIPKDVCAKGEKDELGTKDIFAAGEMVNEVGKDVLNAKDVSVTEEMVNEVVKDELGTKDIFAAGEMVNKVVKDELGTKDTLKKEDIDNEVTKETMIMKDLLAKEQVGNKIDESLVVAKDKVTKEDTKKEMAIEKYSLSYKISVPHVDVKRLIRKFNAPAKSFNQLIRKGTVESIVERLERKLGCATSVPTSSPLRVLPTYILKHKKNLRNACFLDSCLSRECITDHENEPSCSKQVQK